VFLDGLDSFIPVDLLTLLLFLAGVIFKISRLKAQRAQPKAEKTEFLGIAAHDLKNPLTAIIRNAELQIDVSLHGVHRGRSRRYDADPRQTRLERPEGFIGFVGGVGADDFVGRAGRDARGGPEARAYLGGPKEAVLEIQAADRQADRGRDLH
jgi:signal transduction histidine kinase